ncbi:hypothetical protein FA13DRAFT_1735487 [Coprinellus micaceus]|uniref:Uncharacterized protein n=1 Tax=Coprinellus micaceus TaxID=71717 RepID=A0A4Y7T4X3_COPMI|nr:hypothetical protein FA13DRAFT_1735487 [Coprinellus micaceus]
MTPTPEQIQALADAVSVWRTQEYIVISFFAFYVYYTLTTTDKEISVVFSSSQAWNRGKTFHTLIRYGTLLYIALHLARDFRNYFEISLPSCRAMLVMFEAARRVALLTCDLSLGLCLSALLQTNALSLIAILALSLVIPFVASILNIVGVFQYPASPISQLDKELGYPCYVVSFEDFVKGTVMYIGRDVRAYIDLAATAILALLGVATLFVRFKGHGGRLIQVLRRDGGIQYLSLLVIRLVSAILATPALITPGVLDDNPAYLLVTMVNNVGIPILAQRLLINMRATEYVGSQPIASKLLFASGVFIPDGEDGKDGALQDSLEMTTTVLGSRYSAEGPVKRDQGQGTVGMQASV